MPLGLGIWHRHKNFCWSRVGAGDSRFGFAGSITTEGACDTAGGHFLPVVANWMVHVFPLQSDPAKIWAVDAKAEHTMMHASGTLFERGKRDSNAGHRGNLLAAQTLNTPPAAGRQTGLVA